MCSWGRLQIHHDPCHDKALTVDLFWMFQKQLSWIRFLNWLSSTKNESLPYRVHHLPFIVNFIHTTLHILRIVSMVTWRTREVLKIYLHCNISISRLFITGKLSLTRNNAFPILKIKVWRSGSACCQTQRFFVSWLFQMDHIMCLVLHSNSFFWGIALSFCLSFHLTQTGWKRPASGLVPSKIPLAWVSTGAPANLQEALVKTIRTKSVEYLSIGVSRWTSVIFKALKVIHGSVYDWSMGGFRSFASVQIMAEE